MSLSRAAPVAKGGEMLIKRDLNNATESGAAPISAADLGKCLLECYRQWEDFLEHDSVEIQFDCDASDDFDASDVAEAGFGAC
jgi:hypothetical protein